MKSLQTLTQPLNLPSKLPRLWLVMLVSITGLCFTSLARADCPPDNAACERRSHSLGMQKDMRAPEKPKPMWSDESNLPIMARALPLRDYPVLAVGTVDKVIEHLNQAEAKTGVSSTLYFAKIRELYLLTPGRVIHLNSLQYRQYGALAPTSKGGDGMPVLNVRVTQRMRVASPKLNLNLDAQNGNGHWLFPLTVTGLARQSAETYAWQPGAFALPVVFSDPGPKGDALQMLVDQYQDPHGDPNEDAHPALGKELPQLKPQPLHAALEQLRVLYFKGATQAAFAASLTGAATPHRNITHTWLVQSALAKP